MIEEPMGLEFRKQVEDEYAKIDANIPDAKDQIKLLLGMIIQHRWMFNNVNECLNKILNKVKQR